jgi:hypothetical protein
MSSFSRATWVTGRNLNVEIDIPGEKMKEESRGVDEIVWRECGDYWKEEAQQKRV